MLKHLRMFVKITAQTNTILARLDGLMKQYISVVNTVNYLK